MRAFAPVVPAQSTRDLRRYSPRLVVVGHNFRKEAHHLGTDHLLGNSARDVGNTCIVRLEDKTAVVAAAVDDSNCNIVAAGTRNSLVTEMMDDAVGSRTFGLILAPSTTAVSGALFLLFSTRSDP